MITAVLFCTVETTAFAQAKSYTVVPGDTLWKIAVKYQIGTYMGSGFFYD